MEILLFEAKLPVRAVVREALRRGVTVSRTTVRQIAGGTYLNGLAPGETAMTRPIMCDGCGQSLLITPCRLCKARAYQRRLRQVVAELKAADGRTSAPRRERKSSEPAETLKFELRPDAAGRVAELQKRRQLASRN